MTSEELPRVLREAAEIVGADAKPMLRELLLAAAEDIERLRRGLVAAAHGWARVRLTEHKPASTGESLAQLGADIYHLADSLPDLEASDDFQLLMFHLNKLAYKLIHGRERDELSAQDAPHDAKGEGLAGRQEIG